MKPDLPSDPRRIERRRLFLSRALVLGGLAGCMETLMVLTTGVMPPAEVALNVLLLQAAFGGVALTWVFARRLPIIEKIHGESVLVLLSIGLFAFRGCLHNCGDDAAWRLATPLSVALAALGALALLRRISPSRSPAWFILVSTAAMVVSALDFAGRDGLTGGADGWVIVVSGMTVIAILSSFIVQKGWRVKIGWTALLALAAVSWSGYLVRPLSIAPLLRHTSAPDAPEKGRPPNIILIVMDDVRADHLGLYGYGRATSPNLEALARDSVVFDHAVASGNYSLPSHASLLTGLLPSSHGAHLRFGDGLVASKFRRADGGLAPGVETLASKLGASGFTTGGVSANYAYLARWTGLQQGFGAFDDRPKVLLGYHPFSFPFIRRVFQPVQPPQERQEWEGEVVTAAAARFATQAHEPFFLFLNYFDAHDPHFPREGHIFRGDGRGSDARPIPAYDSEIAYVDAAIGDLVDSLRAAEILDRTVLVITADHGEFFGEHGLSNHRVGAYEEVLHVPLLVRYPKVLHAGRVGRTTGLAEVSRLVLDLVASRSPDWLYAEDKEPRVLAQMWGKITADDVILGARSVEAETNVVYMGSLKLIDRRLGKSEMYDLAADPKETHNMLVKPSTEVLALERRMHREVEKLPPARLGSDPDATTADLAALHSLGYIAIKQPGGK